MLLAQQNDYLKDIELKTKHIETLEENVRRMSDRLKSEEQARIVSDSMTETTNNKVISMRDELRASSDMMMKMKRDLSEGQSRYDDQQDIINGLKADIKVKDIEIDILKSRRDA